MDVALAYFLVCFEEETGAEEGIESSVRARYPGSWGRSIWKGDPHPGQGKPTRALRLRGSGCCEGEEGGDAGVEERASWLFLRRVQVEKRATEDEEGNSDLGARVGM